MISTNYTNAHAAPTQLCGQWSSVSMVVGTDFASTQALGRKQCESNLPITRFA